MIQFIGRRIDNFSIIFTNSFIDVMICTTLRETERATEKARVRARERAWVRARSSERARERAREGGLNLNGIQNRIAVKPWLAIWSSGFNFYSWMKQVNLPDLKDEELTTNRTHFHTFYYNPKIGWIILNSRILFIFIWNESNWITDNNDKG